VAERVREPGANRHILWFIPSLEGGGAERVSIDLANAMYSRGLEISIVTAGRAGLRAGETASGVRLVELGARGVATALPGLVRTLQSLRPWAIISVMDHANLVAWLATRLARSAARTVFTTHIEFSHAFEELSPPARRVALALYASVYRRADVRIAVSTDVAERIATRLNVARSSVAVIPNPVVPRRICTLATMEPADVAPPRPEVARVLAIGRLALEKDFDTLIRAIAIATRQVPLELVILGEGPQRPNLQRLVRDLALDEQVRLPGFLPNPYRTLRDARVFVSSSRWEGFGVAIVEAMTLGIPVVATDCPSGPAEILAGGAYGRLVPVGDAGALADAIVAAIRDPGPVAAARRRAADFEIETITQRYLDRLNGIAAE